MNQPTIPEQIEQIKTLLRQKLGIRAPDLERALARAHHRLPRRIYKDGLVLARAAPLAGHPRLRLTLDHDALAKSASDIRGYLEEIDLAEKRKGMFLGMLGSMSFSVLLVAALFIGVLVWRGFL